VSTLKGDIAEGRRVVEKYRHLPRLPFPNFIELCAQTGYEHLAIDRIRANHFFYNYRWVISSAHLAPLYDEPRFEELVGELYEKWELDLDTLGPTLPASPPELPTPEEVLAPG
jgi:hypothetical protein